MFKLQMIFCYTLTQRDISRVNRRHLRLTTPRENHERYVPALARAHLAAESVISANKVSLGLRRVEGAGRVEGREMPPSSNDLPFARNIHARARARHVRERVCVQARTRTQSCGRGLLRTRGDNKICDNQPQRRRRRRHRESVMTLSRTSFQATSVTLRAHLFSHLYSLSLRFVLLPFLPPVSISILISTSISIYLRIYTACISLCL